MSWVAFKIVLSKIWLWIKNYWQVPAIILAIIVSYFVFRRNTKGLIEALSASKESYQEQVEILQKSHIEEIQKRDKLLKQYSDVMDQLKKDYESKQKELTAEEKKKVLEYTKLYSEDPVNLAKVIETRFGIKYVPTNQ